MFTTCRLFSALKLNIFNKKLNYFVNTMASFAGFGNPLLDITVKISDDTLLHKYNLQIDDEKVLPLQTMKSLLSDISGLKQSVSPGGCAQNTLRILQWIIEKPNATVMFGGIGKDAQGQALKKLVTAAGVKTMYVEHSTEQTGTAIALITGTNRSLVAYLGAAVHVKAEDIESKEFISVLKDSKFVYMEGFFITDRLPAAYFVNQFCSKNKIPFAFNLSSVYLSTVHPNDMLRLARSCDILIGHAKEYDALIATFSTRSSVIEFANELSKNYVNSKNLKYHKIVIVTNGPGPVMCVHSDSKVEEFVTPRLEEGQIADTTGAGDAFIAGFLGGLFEARELVTCLKWGCWVAQQIIRQTGVTIPDYSARSLKNIV